MHREQFQKLEKGDHLFYNGDDFYVHEVEQAFNHDLREEVAHTVRDRQGRSVKIIDPWLDEIQIMRAAQDQEDPIYVKRFVLYVAGLEPDSGAWDFISDGLEDVICDNGGYTLDVEG